MFGGGYENAVIVKLSPAGKLVYSTYLGGNNQERALGIAVDATGAVFIAGFTWSADFPLKNALQPNMTGRPDVFVAKLSPTGDRFLFATYLGGSSIDYGEALTLDPSGNPIIVGLTLSPDFPILGGLQRALGGFGIYPTNGFITKLSSSGDRILASTYLGASGSGGLFTVTTDRAGQVYVSGRVSSDGWPLKNPIQSAYGGGQADLYVAKLSPALDSLIYGTYLGGNDNDFSGGLAVDSAGNAYVTGSTYSSDFPLKNSLQPFIGATVGFRTDAFIVKIAPNASLVFSTLVGGHGTDRGSGIAVDPQGKVYVAGLTTSEDFPVRNPLQSTYGGGGGDILLLRMAADIAPVSAFTVSPGTLAFRYILGGAVPLPHGVSVERYRRAARESGVECELAKGDLERRKYACNVDRDSRCFRSQARHIRRHHPDRSPNQHCGEPDGAGGRANGNHYLPRECAYRGGFNCSDYRGLRLRSGGGSPIERRHDSDKIHRQSDASDQFG